MDSAPQKIRVRIAPGYEFDPVKFREILARKEMTPTQVHRLSEISMNTINRLYSGLNRNPLVSILARIAFVLETPIGDFLKEFKT